MSKPASSEREQAQDSSNEPIEVKIIAAASDGTVNVTPDKCEAIRKLLERVRQRGFEEGKERAAQQLERDLGPGINAIPDDLPNGAVKQAGRTRLELCKANIRKLELRP